MTLQDDLLLVWIITPSLNQGRFIGDTIESVPSQDYPRLEYLVRDGGSTDHTLAILRSYGDRLTWKSAPDLGQADAVWPLARWALWPGRRILPARVQHWLRRNFPLLVNPSPTQWPGPGSRP